jgi:thiol-disulfide isomerase/thioredoxin
MNQQHINPSEENEQLLNPPPRQYRVSLACKWLFLCFCLMGFIAYLAMVIERRLSQSQFLMYNQMAAIKLNQSSLPTLMVVNPLTHEELTLNTSGKWMLLNIWATFCPPCKAEMPSLELLQRKFQGELTIVALSVDDTVDAVKEFIDVNKPSFTVLWDKHKTSSAAFGVDKYPETFLISPDGVLVMQFSGPREWASALAFDYFSNVLE